MVVKKLLKKEKGNMGLKQVETEDLEFKSNWRDEYLKVICAFANAAGGKLVIGVDDSNSPIGIKNSKRLLEDIPNKMRIFQTR